MKKNRTDLIFLIDRSGSMSNISSDMIGGYNEFIKKQKDRKEGLIAYQRINEAALKLLNPGGILISCSCSMHLEYDDLVQSLRRASFATECELQIIERGHQAHDHPVHLAIPETDYLKMVIVRKN